MPTNSVILPPPTGGRFRRQKSFIQKNLHAYLFSINRLSALFLFNTTTVALISHKIVTIVLHGPLPIVQLIFFGPFLFCYDLVTLIFLHRGLASRSHALQAISAFISVIIISCSSTFVSLYLEANAEVNWGRSVEVFSNWSFHSKMLAQGSGNFVKTLLFYIAISSIPVLFRRHLELSQSYLDIPNVITEKIEHGEPRSRLFGPFVPLGFILIFGALFLPSQPWRHLTSTLLYDVISTISSVMLSKSLRDIKTCDTSSPIGSSPLGNSYYNPANDPYYITNLDQDIDPFIAAALEGTKFTNVVHIVLESMRADCYPFREDGQLNQHIGQHLKHVENGPLINAQSISPFISSLAENTIVWDSVWSTIPFTHKSMLGYYCGQLPLPVDFTAELAPPAKMYQTCFPQVFRHMNTVTSLEEEKILTMDGRGPQTTDQWETAHIASFTGIWDHTKDLLRYAGFDTIIDAQNIVKLKGEREFDNYLGYFDENGLEVFWNYVDRARERIPKNRLFLGWMSSTTHTPFIINPEWKKENFKEYIEGETTWDTVNGYLNAVRWSDDKVKEIILGFRERGLEKETLFIIQGDHGFPFVGPWPTPVENPHNEAYQMPFMIYNPLIHNPKNQTVQGNFYGPAIPTTILDLMSYTKSFAQLAQRELANKFAANYEFAQSFLRPVKEAIRFFFVHPGGSQWVLDNGRNLRAKFTLNDDHVYVVDYIKDPLESDNLDSWNGVEGLIAAGAEEKFGEGTEEFLREAHKRQAYMRTEIFRRYGLGDQ